MIATQTLSSPSRGAVLPAASAATVDPAAFAVGPVAGSAGSSRAAPAAFGTLLAISTAPVSATIPAPTPLQPSSSETVVAASLQPPAFAADLLAAAPNPPSAGFTEPVTARSIAFFTAPVAIAVPGQFASATGNAPPPTGKRLPLSGSTGPTALAIPLAPTAIPLAPSATASDPEDAPTDGATPADPALPILLTPPSLALIDPALVVVAPVLAPAAPPAQIPPADIARGAPPALPASHPAATTPIGTAQPSDGAAARFVPLTANLFARAATAAPLARRAADAALPQSSVAIKVVLPAAAAVADTPIAPLASPLQPTMRARALTDAAAPADRREAQAGELLPNATDIAPAPSVAPLLPPALAAHADPLVPAAAASAAPADRIDFATLVDTIAQAREHAAPQTASAPVSVSLAHADFGPVALRFRHDGDALAVTMASADPGFAPAVSAASLADAGARAGQQQTDSQPSQHQPGSGQPQSSGSASGSASQGFAQGQAGQSQAGQGQPDQRQNRPGGPAPATRAASRATDTGGSDPDIFA